MVARHVELAEPASAILPPRLRVDPVDALFGHRAHREPERVANGGVGCE